MAIAGKVAITPKGNWNESITYEKLDFVFYNDNSYVALKPSTGIVPTNTEYWMLCLQGASKTEIEAIITGTQQVGNAKTLDGHGAEYFAHSADLANYLPLTGGKVSNNEVTVLTVESKSDDSRTLIGFDKKGVRQGWLGFNGENKPVFGMIGGSAFELLHTGNMASHVLPLTSGTDYKTITRESSTVLDLNTTATYSNRILVAFLNNGNSYGALGFNTNNKPIAVINAVESEFLHTGNKPTGTYVGNGDKTERIIATGGIGITVIIWTEEYGGFTILTPHGGMGKVSDASTVSAIPWGEAGTSGAGIILRTTNPLLNASGKTYYWSVL